MCVFVPVFSQELLGICVYRIHELEINVALSITGTVNAPFIVRTCFTYHVQIENYHPFQLCGS